jgi:hypothetical protein
MCLWDEISLPQNEAEKISGPVVPCIGFDIDPNAMTIVMFPGR